MCYNLSDLVSVSLARLWFISKKHMYTFVISCKCLGKMYLSCYFLYVVWVKRHLSRYPQFIPFNKVYVHVSSSVHLYVHDFCISGFYIKDVEAPLCTISDLSSQRFLSWGMNGVCKENFVWWGEGNKPRRDFHAKKEKPPGCGSSLISPLIKRYYFKQTGSIINNYFLENNPKRYLLDEHATCKCDENPS